MKNLIISIAFSIGTNIAFAQDAVEVPSMLDEVTARLTSDKRSLDRNAEKIRVLAREYVEVFNARDSSKLAQNIFMTPVQFSTFVLPGIIEIEVFFEKIYAGMEPNWDHTNINNIDVCLAGPGLAFVDMNYSRIDAAGEPMRPVERASLLIIRMSKGQWRISAVHLHDATKKVTC